MCVVVVGGGDGGGAVYSSTVNFNEYQGEFPVFLFSLLIPLFFFRNALLRGTALNHCLANEALPPRASGLGPGNCVTAHPN